MCIDKINKYSRIINLGAALFAGLVGLWFISLGDWGYAALNVGLAVLNFFLFWRDRRGWWVRTNDRS